MSDIVDNLDVAAEIQRDKRIREMRENVKKIMAGKPGICDECGEFSQRVVGGLCAHCRDDIEYRRRYA